MKYILERHAYAPELNKIIIKSSSGWHWVKAPGVQSVKQWREQNKPSFGIFCTLSAVRGGEWASLNRHVSGFVHSRAEALSIAKAFRARHAGGPLLDGRILPDARIIVRTVFIGA
jgi:hypothetical protein